MPRLLHILTRPADAQAAAVIEAQKQLPENEVFVVDLTQPDPDYGRLVDEVFAADSIASW